MEKKENRLSIGRINGIEIFAVELEDGTTIVPVRPICEAIGVSLQGQSEKINEDEILSSVVRLSLTTGTDGKQYEMLCLPLEYIYGWIFTINPKNVNPHAKESVIKYKRECYEVLYRHFHKRAQRQAEANQAEIEILKQLNEALTEEKSLKSKIRNLNSALAKVRSSRLDDQPSLFD